MPSIPEQLHISFSIAEADLRSRDSPGRQAVPTKREPAPWALSIPLPLVLFLLPILLDLLVCQDHRRAYPKDVSRQRVRHRRRRFR
jgi:hypothetical protein